MRIPLIRASFPPLDRVLKLYKKAYKNGQHSNFGKLFYQSVHFLSDKSKRECLPVSTGTAAIEIGCRLRFKNSERILVPDYTHIGTIQAIVAAGCKPILCKTDSKTWTLSPEIIKEHVNVVDGVVVVSPFGYPVDVNGTDKLCRELGIGVVYDFAGAWGEFPKTENPVCYSLHATKNFSCGEGGIVSVKTTAEWEMARWFTNFCNNPDRSVQCLDGRNHKPSELLCAVILAHKESHDELLYRSHVKRNLVSLYAVETGFYAPIGGHVSLCVLQGLTNHQAMLLNRMGIEVKQYYPPFPFSLCERVSTTNSSEISRRYALPSDIRNDEFDRVIKAIKKIRRLSPWD